MAAAQINRWSTRRRLLTFIRTWCCCALPDYQLLLLDEDDDQLTEDQVRSVVTERTLVLVSQHIGGGMQMLGVRLGLPYVCVERCQLSQPCSPVMQTFAMLNKWRQLKGRRATVGALVEALKDSMSVCTVDLVGVYRALRDTQEL